MARTVAELLETIEVTIDAVGARSAAPVCEPGAPAGADEPGRFGGLALARAVNACGALAGDHRLHHVAAQFLATPDPAAPTRYEVTPLADGRRRVARHVTAIQDGIIRSTATVTFLRDVAGPARQLPAAAVPQPEDLASFWTQLAAAGARWPSTPSAWSAIELRWVTPPHRAIGMARLACWVRLAGPLPADRADDEQLHRCLLAYLSDAMFIVSGVTAAGHDPTEQTAASLDHAVWIHRTARPDDWLLFEQSSPVSTGGHTMVTGTIRDRHGAIVATAAQSGLLLTPPAATDRSQR